ncbi:MAG: BPSS1780 family membrane protein [Betaproteobacteria bacterium]
MQVIDAPANAGIGWIRQSFAMFTAQPAGWISLLACWMLLTLVVFVVVPIIGPALATMLQPGLFAGFIIAARDQEAGQPVTLSRLFAGFRFNGRALLMLGSITLLAEILTVVVLGLIGFPRTIPLEANGWPDMRAYAQLLDGKEWMVLAGVGLMLLIKAILWFATPLLALHPMRAGHAIRWSFYAFVGNFVPMLLFGVMMCGVFFLAAMPWLLGLLVALPMYALAHYLSYRQVFPAD